MSASRVAAWLFGAAVLGAWLASAAGVSRPARQARAAQPQGAASGIDSLAADVQAQAGRLRQRLENAPAPTPSQRNPFAFAERPAPARRLAPRAEPADVPPAAAPAPVEPRLELIGIAEKSGGATTVRTAMLSAGDTDNLIMAVAGQQILGAYEVVSVGTDAIELRNLATGASRRLVLR